MFCVDKQEKIKNNCSMTVMVSVCVQINKTRLIRLKTSNVCRKKNWPQNSVFKKNALKPVKVSLIFRFDYILIDFQRCFNFELHLLQQT